jgi:hypothetical protein
MGQISAQSLDYTLRAGESFWVDATIPMEVVVLEQLSQDGLKEFCIILRVPG